MKLRDKSNLHVVSEELDPTDEIIDKILDELHDEDGSMEELEAKIVKHRKQFRIRVIVNSVLIIALVVGTYLFMTNQTYTSMRVISQNMRAGTDNGNYKQFGDGILKYTRDGVAFLDQKGDEKWNQPFQMKLPIVVVENQAAALADQGGNSIMVFEVSGLKGEITTNLPIEKISVSRQGIVAAILKNGSTPQVNCYDAAGNLLVEHKATMAKTGYPVDLSISPNGELLMVSYLHTTENRITSKIVYYNFGEVGQGKTDHQVAASSYDNEVMPFTFFADANTSVAIGDQQVIIYKGNQIPKISEKIQVNQEIKSAFYDEKYIGLVLKNKGRPGYELRLYHMNGNVAMTTDFTGDYGNIRISGDKIIMYEGNRCAIFTRWGQKRFEGKSDVNISEIIPMLGFNKYLVMNANGMEEIRLVK